MPMLTCQLPQENGVKIKARTKGEWPVATQWRVRTPRLRKPLAPESVPDPRQTPNTMYACVMPRDSPRYRSRETWDWEMKEN